NVHRRRSMPPSCHFENDVTRALCKEGYAKFETNVVSENKETY
uniref:Uncharacterized protein n=1 Tax=Caenorhabditis japonica TaxID=281687 RepID=A0A8R1EWG4_CAEJA